MGIEKAENSRKTGNAQQEFVASYDGSIGGEMNQLNAEFPDDHTRQRMMIETMLDGTFDENIRIHAENLAEKLIERQEELDRREAQLNRLSAEIENNQRQLRLSEELLRQETADRAQLKPLIIAEEVSEAEAEVAEAANPDDDLEAVSTASATEADDQLLSIRIDKYCNAQRQPYSRFNSRLRKYAGNTVNNATDRDAPAANESVDHVDSAGMTVSERNDDHFGSLDPISPKFAHDNSVLTSINRLTQSATQIRHRGEQIDMMYDNLTDIFSEMLRQQGLMREMTSSLSGVSSIEEAGKIQSVRKELNRLTIQLTMVGRDHFLLPEETAEAA